VVPFLLALLPLAACSDADWAHAFTYAGAGGASPSEAQASVPISPHPVTVRGYTNVSCEDAARERANEAHDQGFDGDVQRAVHDKVYAECDAFQTKAQ
jgi:hypothetical protein